MHTFQYPLKALAGGHYVALCVSVIESYITALKTRIFDAAIFFVNVILFCDHFILYIFCCPAKYPQRLTLFASYNLSVRKSQNFFK